jgi:hypothetical protein
MEQSCIYFVSTRDRQAVKIGIARYPWARICELRIGSPVPLDLLAHVPGDARDERDLHEYFRESRMHGEWFRRTSELIFLMGLLRPWAIKIPRNDPEPGIRKIRERFERLISRAFPDEDAAQAVLCRP